MAPVDSSVSHSATALSNGNTAHDSAVDADIHVHSITRVVDLPVVKSALGYASGFYTRVKGYNLALESGLSRAELTVQLVADSAKPVIQKFEKPLNYADSLVCQGLDKLEEKVPSIRSSPEELKTAGWGTYEAIKKAGSDRLQTLRSYVSTQASNASDSQVAHVVIRSVDSALNLAEQALDHYLPRGQDEEEEAVPAGDGRPESGGSESSPSEGRNNQSVTTASGLVERATRVSDKMRKRLLRTDLLLVKRAMGLLTPVRELTSPSH